MKQELSSLDLHYLVKEFQVMLNGKIDKVFQKDDVFLFQLYVPSKGKKYLRVILPSLIYLSEYKEKFEETGKFGLSIRKHINNTRIREIKQREFERILEFKLESRNKILFLYIELFKPGNIILTNEDKKIIMASEYKGFGSRVIRPGIKYEYPMRDINFLELEKNQLKDLLKKSKKSSVVITLATNLGLGGEYAEEICKIAKIDKNKKELDEKEIESLFEAAKKLKNQDKKLNKELDKFYTVKTKKDKKEKQESKFEKKKKQMQQIIKQQETTIKGLKKSVKENQEKGELIYENYTKIENILKQINEAKKTMSWKEIKKEIPKKVKIDEKQKKITLDI